MTKQEEQIERLIEETERLRAALNNLIGAIVNKKISGLEEDVEEARDTLETEE